MKCAHCEMNEATCVGSYEGHEPEGTPACDECCGHGNEDGHCKMIEDAEGEPHKPEPEFP